MSSEVIILDRDGVINEDSDDYIKSPQEWIPIKGSLEAIKRLNKAGFKVALASNQSGIARGYFDEAMLESMHDKMKTLLAQRGARIDEIEYCPHGPTDNCLCRKPKPGMLLQIAKKLSVKPAQMTFVGDSLSDIQAARMAGVKPVLVKTGKGLKTLDKLEPDDAIPVFNDLAHFVRELTRKK
jgi:D-glycero-D-manno-heptose 1,7-bisphosphate phosphatase